MSTPTRSDKSPGPSGDFAIRAIEPARAHPNTEADRMSDGKKRFALTAMGALCLAIAGCEHPYLKDAARLREPDPCGSADFYNRWIEQVAKGTPPKATVEKRDA